MKVLFLGLLLAGFANISGEKVRYDNFRVYSVQLENANQFKLLQKLFDYESGVSILNSISARKSADILVSPQQVSNVTALFKTHSIKNELRIENLQNLIDAEQSELLCSSYDWKHYYDLKAINTWLDDMVRRHRKILTSYTYGTSYEGRPLRAFKLSHKPGNPTIFIESTIHAREWITVATATYLLNELLENRRDDDIKYLAENYDWVVVPVVNVDGYEYTHTSNRMWQKNRNPYSDIWNCVGANLNRNFDFHHGEEEGASRNSCDETYAGPSPFSEPETMALAQFIKTFHNIKLYLAFHSYSQLLLFPYGHSTQHAKNHDHLYQVGKRTAQAIAQRFGTEYTTGDFAETIYLASGTSVDWVYGVRNVSLAFTSVFRDKGHHGFILPAEQIIPNGMEFIDGLKAMIREAQLLNYL